MCELKAARRIRLHKKLIAELRKAGFGYLIPEYVRRIKIDTNGKPLTDDRS